MTDNQKHLTAGLLIGIAATSFVVVAFTFGSDISKPYALELLTIGGILVGLAFYWFRSRYKPFYGSFEVLFGWATVMYLATSVRTGNFSFPQLIGGLYVIVRGFDNIQKGLNDRGVKTRWLRLFQDYRPSEEQSTSNRQQTTLNIEANNALSVAKACFIFILAGGLLSSLVVYRVDEKIRLQLDQRERDSLAEKTRMQFEQREHDRLVESLQTPTPTPTSSARPPDFTPVPEPTPARVPFARNAVGGETQEGDYTWNAPANTEIVHVDIQQMPNSDGIRSISIIKQSLTQFTAHYYARSDKTLFDTHNALLNVEFTVTLRNKTTKP